MDSFSDPFPTGSEANHGNEPAQEPVFQPRLAVESDLPVEAYRDILSRSALADRRPLDDQKALRQLLERASLIVTARDPSDNALIGLARLMCDGVTVCFVADLAVDRRYQGRGIGAALIQRAHAEAGDHLRLLLVSPPQGNSYYARMGMTPVSNAWAFEPRRTPTV